MNIQRLLLTILAGFAFLFASDFLIHGVWLAPTYKATAELWRPEADMQSYFPWILVGEFLCAAMFVIIWAQGFADRASVRCAIVYGLMLGLFSQATTLIDYAVMPLPGRLAAQWLAAGLAQAILLGLLTCFIYKPHPPAPSLTIQ